MVGHDGADRVALAVVGLLAEQHEVGRLALERLRQRVARRGHVGARERVVGQVHGAVGAERDRLVQRAHRARRAHRDGDDLVDLDGPALADLHRRLDRVRVVRVQVLLAAAVHAAGATESIRFWTAASGTSFTRTQIFTWWPPLTNEAWGSYKVD